MLMLVLNIIFSWQYDGEFEFTSGELQINVYARNLKVVFWRGARRVHEWRLSPYEALVIERAILELKISKYSPGHQGIPEELADFK